MIGKGHSYWRRVHNQSPSQKQGIIDAQFPVSQTMYLVLVNVFLIVLRTLKVREVG